MSHQYVVRPKRNPSEKGTPPKYYAVAKSRGTTDTADMAEIIAYATTFMEPDVIAVLKALQQVIVENIKKGMIIGLGDLGKFQLTLNSKGALTEKDFNQKLVQKCNCRFFPGPSLMLAGEIVWVKLNYDKPRKTEEDEEGGEDDEVTGEEP